MTDVKEIEKKTYVWAHVGVIIYHSLVGILLIMSRYSDMLLGFNSRDVVFVLGIILLVTALLSLWPILKDYDRIEIE